MWLELLQIFRGKDPLKALADEFIEMLETTHEMAKIVRPHIFDHSLELAQRERIYELDIKVNKLERSIRKRVVAHLSVDRTEVAYCLLLMSLVKDVERIGDYAKNIAEVSEMGGTPPPAEGPLRGELEAIVDAVMLEFGESRPIMVNEDRERAGELLQQGRITGKRCDRLVSEVARSDLDAAQATTMVLLTRFYKRLGAHLDNVLSSLVMPLHKVDFYDEKYLPEAGAKKATTKPAGA